MRLTFILEVKENKILRQLISFIRHLPAIYNVQNHIKLWSCHLHNLQSRYKVLERDKVRENLDLKRKLMRLGRTGVGVLLSCQFNTTCPPPPGSPNY